MPVVVEVTDVSDCATRPDNADLERWAAAALGSSESPARVGLRIVDEAEGRALNARWRGRDYATNVLAFPADDLPGEWAAYLGDIVVCAPVVLREAAEFGRPPAQHWAHLVVHGCLHLLGFTHDDPRTAADMEARERAVLRQFGIPDPYVSP